LVGAGLAEDYETEKSLGTDLTCLSDIFVTIGGEPVRLEFMWRKTTSRAEIASYVLGKLGNYERAVGLLD
jgi:hypothetical protein